MSYLKLWEKFWVTDLWSKGAVMGKIALNRENCIGCGLCIKACPGKSLILDENKNPIPKEAAELQCVSCGACMAICPQEAITITTRLELTGMFKTLRRGPLAPPRLFEDLAKN